MSIFQAIVLALVHGITEILPISSSAHLALAPWLLGWPDQELTFDIALHFGTLLALLAYFGRDWVQIVAQAMGFDYSPDADLRLNPTLLWLLVFATIPLSICGLVFKEAADTTLRNPVITGSTLIGVAILMLIAERVGRQDRTISGIGMIDAMAIGLAQALAIAPGTSRSGITITIGVFRGLDRHSAGRFSFLIAIPSIAAATSSTAYDLHTQGGIPHEMVAPFAAGVLVSAVSGTACIALLMRFLRTHSLRVFAYYRLALGSVILVLALLIRP